MNPTLTVPEPLNHSNTEQHPPLTLCFFDIRPQEHHLFFLSGAAALCVLSEGFH